MTEQLRAEPIIVGIVVFNTDIRVVKKTFTSIKSSSVQVEIICLCNSSDINYQSAIAVLCSEFGVKLIANAPNQGFGAGHNAIWRASCSEWYVCCNPDIEVDGLAVERLVLFGMNHPEASLLMPRVLNPNGTIQPVARKHPTFFRWVRRQIWRIVPGLISPSEIAFDYNLSQPVNFVTGCFFLARRDLLVKLNGFDESFFLYAEDADLSRRAEVYGPNWYVSDAVVWHDWAANWAKNTKSFYLAILGLVKYWKKHGIF